MKKIRYYLAIIALAATLSGPYFLQTMGSGAMANAASSQHVSSPFATGHTTKSVAFKPYPQCPVIGLDC